MSVGSVKQTKRLKRTFQPNSLFKEELGLMSPVLAQFTLVNKGLTKL